MLDIKGIKQKINEVLRLNENNDSVVIKLFNILKNKDGFRDTFVRNGGDDTKFDDILMSRCEEYVYNPDIYQMDKRYQDVDWIAVSNLIFNYEEIWNDWEEYCKNLYSEDKIGELDTLGNDMLEEQVLMEMPANNYMSFDIEPYIICEEEYSEDDNGNIIEGDSWMPFYDYVTGERFSRYDWVNDYSTRNYDAIALPGLNKNINNDLIRIIGHSGYYDGMTVGIIARDIDSCFYDLRWDYFNEGPEENTYLYFNDDKVYTESEAIDKLQEIQNIEIEKAKDILLETNTIEGGKVVPSSYAYKAPTETGADMMDESVLKENTDNEDTLIWLRDHPYFVRYGEEKTISYKGYDINIEGCIERYDDYSVEHYYHLQFYISDIENDDEARVYETSSPQEWEDVCDTIEEYVENHPLEDYNPPKDDGAKGWEIDESYQQLNEDENDEFEYWKNHEPIEADASISFDYKGFHITVDNMEGDHFDVNIYKMINQSHNRNSIYPNINYSEYEFYAYSWSRIFDGIIAYERRYPINQDSDESENDNPPKDDGAKGWEIDESYQQLNEDYEGDWNLNYIPDIIGTDETATYNFYDYEIKFDSQQIHGIDYYNAHIIQNGRQIILYTMENWNDLCRKVSQWLKLHSDYEQKQMLDSYNFSKNVLTNLKIIKQLYDYYCNSDKIEEGFENDAYENMVWYMTDFIDKVIFDIRSKYTYNESADVLKTLYETTYAFKDIVIDFYKRYIDIDYFDECNENEEESWEDLMERSNLSDMIRYIPPDKQYECVNILYDKFMIMVNELEDLFKIKEPEDTGAEWIEENRNLDIKNIKKQINEIVKIVG